MQTREKEGEKKIGFCFSCYPKENRVLRTLCFNKITKMLSLYFKIIPTPGKRVGTYMDPVLIKHWNKN